jgi:hypothetical protein
MLIADKDDEHYRDHDHDRQLQVGGSAGGGTAMVEAITFVAITLATLLIVGVCYRLGYVPLLPVGRSRLNS